MLSFYLAIIDSPEEKRKFENLYQLYRKTMFYAAYSILQNEMSAEDAVHQAFLRVIDHLDKINPDDCHKTKAFLVVITEHIAIDQYRKQKRENWISYDEVGENYLTQDNVPMCKNEVLEAIMRLPAAYSTIFRLKYSQGYTNEEIAAILQITEENVRQRISRGKKKLERLLEGVREDENRG